MIHTVRVLLEVTTFGFAVLVACPQCASTFVKTPTRRKFLIPLVACAVLVFLANEEISGTIAASDQPDSSPQRVQFVRTWAQAKQVLHNAMAKKDSPACSADIDVLYKSMMKTADDVERAISVGKSTNMQDPQNNSMVSDLYVGGCNIRPPLLPPLINMTKTDCGV
ncbi:hypothetical protein [Paraburkholderia youngii]|uniref:Uncharacterized protein n=1 Tax=Paraburkholderia youngii TaxID=2782701 RepID=A0A7W8LD30_9BURK|nr:hypothetical protein [Paraburkholderia youngii]MBB5404448.1 hypothetical protein [Paraburkholderia youngii]